MGITLFDILLLINYLVVIYFFSFLYVKKKVKTNPEYKYFIPGLSLKVLGAIGFSIVYIYYYDVGDTFLYYRGGQELYNILSEDISAYFQLLFTSSGTFSEELGYYANTLTLYNSPEGFLMSKITSVLILLSFNSYWLINILCALFSFFGLWKLYKFFNYYFPGLYKYLAIGIFFIPSVFFWGSGLLKDSFTIGGLGFLLYSVNNLFVSRRQIILNALILILSAYLILILKAYIIMAFIPALTIWVYIRFIKKINDFRLKLLLSPLLIFFIFISGWVLINNLSELSSSYKIENLVGKAKDFHGWHEYLSESEGQSGYSLGEVDYSLSGVLKKVPAAINVTLFRPYFWEVNNVVMLMAALESAALLMLTLFVGYKVRLRFFNMFVRYPEVALCIVFTLVFAFAVGFTSYNFGALVRYKIPCIPFYVSCLFILWKKNERAL